MFVGGVEGVFVGGVEGVLVGGVEGVFVGGLEGVVFIHSSINPSIHPFNPSIHPSTHLESLDKNEDVVNTHS